MAIPGQGARDSRHCAQKARRLPLLAALTAMLNKGCQPSFELLPIMI